MRAVVYNGPRDVAVQEVPDARIERPTDVLVRITRDEVIAHGYSYRKAKRRLFTYAAELHDVADYLEQRPLETVFKNLVGEGSSRLRPGCKCFDAHMFPKPSELQKTLDLMVESYTQWRAAYLLLSSADKVHVTSPRP